MQPDTTPVPGFTITTEPKADWWHLRAPSGRSVGLLSDEELDEWGIDPSFQPPEPDERITDFSIDRRGFTITVVNGISLTATFRCEEFVAGPTQVPGCWWVGDAARGAAPSFRRDLPVHHGPKVERLDRLVLDHPVLSLVAANYGISA